MRSQLREDVVFVASTLWRLYALISAVDDITLEGHHQRGSDVLFSLAPSEDTCREDKIKVQSLCNVSYAGYGWAGSWLGKVDADQQTNRGENFPSFLNNWRIINMCITY